MNIQPYGGVRNAHKVSLKCLNTKGQLDDSIKMYFKEESGMFWSICI